MKEEKEFVWFNRKGGACERGAMDKAMGSKKLSERQHSEKAEVGKIHESKSATRRLPKQATVMYGKDF